MFLKEIQSNNAKKTHESSSSQIQSMENEISRLKQENEKLSKQIENNDKRVHDEMIVKDEKITKLEEINRQLIEEQNSLRHRFLKQLKEKEKSIEELLKSSKSTPPPTNESQKLLFQLNKDVNE